MVQHTRTQLHEHPRGAHFFVTGRRRGRAGQREIRKRRPRYVQSVTRALQVLKLFSPHQPRWSVTDVVETMRLEKSTVSRLLSTMAAEGFVFKDPHTGKYELAPRTYQIGLAYLSGLTLRRVAMPYLEELAFAVSETVYLGVLGDGAAVYIDKILSPLSLRVDSYIGCAIPLHATALGKALLAGQRDEYIDALVRGGLRAYTRRTITSPKELRSELRRIRRQGFALDLEEFEENLHCVGLPLRDYRGAVVAAFSVSGPAIRFTRQVIATHLPRLKRVAATISSRLGFEPGREDSWPASGGAKNGRHAAVFRR